MSDPLTEKELRLLDQVLAGSGIDGDHHKQHHFDQLLRILTDCPLVQKAAVDAYGRNYVYKTYGESELYKRIVSNYVRGVDDVVNTEPRDLTDDEYERGDYYEWDTGIPG